MNTEKNTAEAIYLSNLQDCRPADAVSAEPERRKWRLIEYETDACSGVMLAAGEETAAREVSYSPRVSGWYRIYIGLFYDQTGESGIQVRLSNDATWSANRRAAGSDVRWSPSDGLSSEPGFEARSWR